MKETSTFTPGSVNHADRTIGSYIGKMSNVEDRELESIGLWGGNNSSVMGLHYTKVRTSDTIARMAGFDGAHEYYLARATFSPFDVAKFSSPRDQELFRGFMPFLDDHSIEQKLLQMQQKDGYNCGINCFRALQFLRLIFWQDAAILYRENKDLEIFTSLLIKSRIDVFERWSRFVCQHEDKVLTNGNESGESGVNPEIIQSLESTMAEFRVALQSVSLKLDKAIAAKEDQSGSLKRRSDGDKESTRTKAQRPHVFLKRLRALHGK